MLCLALSMTVSSCSDSQDTPFEEEGSKPHLTQAEYDTHIRGTYWEVKWLRYTDLEGNEMVDDSSYAGDGFGGIAFIDAGYIMTGLDSGGGYFHASSYNAETGFMSSKGTDISDKLYLASLIGSDRLIIYNCEGSFQSDYDPARREEVVQRVVLEKVSDPDWEAIYRSCPNLPNAG